jgi:hypothetical protein
LYVKLEVQSVETIRDSLKRDGLPTMSMACTILLALVAGTGGHPVNPALDRARPAGERAIRAQGPCPSRSLSIARKSWHRAGSRFCSTDLEEFDTEETDESWIVDLDAMASVPNSWLCMAWLRAESRPRVLDGIVRPPSSHFPLRC